MSLPLQKPLLPNQTMVRFAGNPVQNLTLGQKATRFLSVYGNYIDQRAVVQRFGWPVNRAMVAAGVGLTGWHAFKAQPEERKKVLVRDALVLGGTIGGTILASGGLVGLKQLVTPIELVEHKVGEKLGEKAKALALYGAKPLAEEGKHLVEEAKKSIDKLPGEIENLHPQVVQTLKNHLDNLGDEAELSTQKLKNLYDKLFEFEPKRVGEIFEKIFDENEEEVLKGGLKKESALKKEIGEAINFFGIGAIGVLSGIGGGLVANKINGVKDPEKTPNMVKEGIFQFVANIGMCAVGAGSALVLMKPNEWIDKVSSSESVRKAAKTVDQIFNHSAGSKLYRFGGVLAGLSVGILGGAHIANYVGRHWVNPALDKIQGKPSKPPEQQGKRHIEGMDMVLHVDDIPTAAAIAGTAILGPWIMPFFPVSGYKAGIGYRNDESAKKSKDKKQNFGKLPGMVPGQDALSQAASTTNKAFAAGGNSPFSQTGFGMSAVPPQAFGQQRPNSPFSNYASPFGQFR